jgi:hypothetical protein
VFAKELEKQLCLSPTTDANLPFPCLEDSAKLRRVPFSLQTAHEDSEKYDLVLFYHSMYGVRTQKNRREKVDSYRVSSEESIYMECSIWNLPDQQCHVAVTI